MFCFKCGQQITDGAAFCAFCGVPQPTYQQPIQTPYQQSAQTSYVPTSPLSWKAFYNHFASKKTKNFVIWLAIICFVSAAISIPAMLISKMPALIPLYIIDIVVYASVGTLLLSTKLWIFALFPTAYSGIWSLISLANNGNLTGILALFFGIFCSIALIKLNKAYRTYKTTGYTPQQMI